MAAVTKGRMAVSATGMKIITSSDVDQWNAKL